VRSYARSELVSGRSTSLLSEEDVLSKDSGSDMHVYVEGMVSMPIEKYDLELIGTGRRQALLETLCPRPRVFGYRDKRSVVP